MRLDTLQHEQMIATAVQAATDGDALAQVLDRIPAAIYVTDAEGVITHFNKACIALAGRTPVARQDRWCVTWKIFTTDGEFLPHERCPMAVAIRDQRRIRGVEAVAERPDGTRVNFVPYPTPMFDAAGVLTGAVNLLVDVTDQKQAAHLRAQAVKCRRLLVTVSDSKAASALNAMAAEYDAQADRLAQRH